MNSFHNIVHKVSVAFLVLCFVFVSTYIPQPWNKINKAEAGAVFCVNCSTIALQLSEWQTQLLDYAEGVSQTISGAATAIATEATAISSSITAIAVESEWFKEFTLDGIAWAIAKAIVSQMTKSIVNWINSGFQGSPAFVQDLKGFLLSVADSAIGQYLDELGGPFSFICSPFKLDVRVALATSYSKSREGKPASTCTLSGALANIQNFAAGSFDQGGWDSWFTITSQPEAYTPYGSLLSAEAEASVRIINAKGQEVKLLDFGKGFLSKKVCEQVISNAGPTQKCVISTPGDVIAEALTFELSTGPRSLIEADEINEIIGALIGQVAKTVITGAAGLLGLSSGTGYTYTGYSGGSFMNEAASNASTVDYTQIVKKINDSKAAEVSYKAAAITYKPLLAAYATNTANLPKKQAAAQAAANKIPALVVAIDDNILKLDTLIAQWATLPAAVDLTNDSEMALRTSVVQEYAALASKLHSQNVIDADINSWQSLLKN